MLPLVAVFLFLVSSDAAAVDVHTFKYEDPETGNMLHCALCPPGTFVSSPCTRTLDTVCLPCPEHHFTQFWNFLPKCLYCSNICEGSRRVKTQCSATHNRECECKEGHFWQDDFCIPYTRCPPGMGVKIMGKTDHDTQCEMCPSGTFSMETSSSERCIKHTDCESLHVLLPGRSWHDSICSSCDQLTHKESGGINLLRNILPGLFSHRKIKLSKLKRFVHFIEEKDCTCEPGFSNEQVSLLRYITEWTENASMHQLKALPKMLQKSGLRSCAENVQNLITKINESVSLCQNQ